MLKKYEDIWEILKRKGHVALAVPIPLHKRVKRGLVNRKDRDPVFKLQANIDKRKYYLSFISESSRIRIFLRFYRTDSLLEQLAEDDTSNYEQEESIELDLTNL